MSSTDSLTSQHPPARYFPVGEKPLKATAGLFPFGTDFGNGDADRRTFQVDQERPRYVFEKRQIASALHVNRDPKFDDIHLAAMSWLKEKLAEEIPDITFSGYSSIAELQEDVVVMIRHDGGGQAIMLHVSFPSGWRPESLLNGSFSFIHRPVPGFAGEKIGHSMMSAMLDRPPSVRFVWTVTADAVLDHHPDRYIKSAWTEDATEAWLRVERQTIVRLPEVEAAMFVIRTFVYPFSGFSADQRKILAEAIRVMPDDMAVYKGLPLNRQAILRLLTAENPS